MEVFSDSIMEKDRVRNQELRAMRNKQEDLVAMKTSPFL